MKKISIFLILINSIVTFSQDKKNIYVDKSNDYVIFLDKDIKTSQKLVNGTEVSVFVKTNENGFNYTFLISKIFEHSFISGDLLSEEYESYFLNTCDCTIIEKEQVTYNNLKTLRYKIKVEDGGKTYIGYNDSFVSGDFLYNNLFLTFESYFGLQSENYSTIMNSFIVNGKTTINGSPSKLVDSKN